ncbi:hypothetical protein H4R35_005195 [Dimargaris xerosporica]|nr:hypothetical protein H4R35_005195 [Dimargaris xerosporica]
MTNYTSIFTDPDHPSWIPGPAQNQAIAIGFGAFTALALAYVLVSTAFFYHMGRRVRDIQQRSMRLTLWHSVAVFGYVLMAGTANARQNLGYPCFLQLWGTLLFGMLHTMTFTTKVLRFLFQFHYNRDKLGMRPTRHPPIPDKPETDGSLPWNTPIVSNAAALTSTSSVSKGWFNRWLSRRKDTFLSEIRCLWIVLGAVAVAAVYCLVLQIVDPAFRLIPLEVRCVLSWEYLPIIVVILINSLFVNPLLLGKLWGAKDGYGIQQEIILCCIFLALSMVATMVWGFLPGPHQYTFACYMWPAIAVLILHSALVTWPVIKNWGAQHLRYRYSQVSIASTDSDNSRNFLWHSFLNMLAEPVGLARLKVWSSQLFCTELIMFLEEYHDLKGFLANTYPPPARMDKPLRAKGAMDPSQPLLYKQANDTLAALVHQNHPMDQSIPLTPLTLSAKPENHEAPGYWASTSNHPGLALSDADLRSVHEKPVVVDVESPSEITYSIRETWNLSKYQRPVTPDPLGNLTAGDAEEPTINISQHPSLQLAYYMFYQRFVEKPSDLRVAVPPHLLAQVERKVNTQAMTADIFDDVRKEVLKLVFNDVYLKCIDWK